MSNCGTASPATISANTNTEITISDLTDGTTYGSCQVSITDSAGNAGTQSLNSFTYNNSAPTIQRLQTM